MKETGMIDTMAVAKDEGIDVPRKCTTIDLLQEEVQQNDVRSMIMLSLYYIYGIGVEKSNETAAELLEKAYSLVQGDYQRALEVDLIADGIIQTVLAADNLPLLQESAFNAYAEEEDVDIEDLIARVDELPDDKDWEYLWGLCCRAHGREVDELIAENGIEIKKQCEALAKRSLEERAGVSVCEKYYQDILYNFHCECGSIFMQPPTGLFVLRELRRYAKMERYNMNGEALTLPEGAQRSGITEAELKARIDKGLSTADVLRPFDEKEMNECDKSGDPSLEAAAEPTRAL